MAMHSALRRDLADPCAAMGGTFPNARSLLDEGDERPGTEHRSSRDDEVVRNVQPRGAKVQSVVAR